MKRTLRRYVFHQYVRLPDGSVRLVPRIAWLPAALAILVAVALSSCDVHEFPDDPPAPVPAVAMVELDLKFATEMPLHTTVEYKTRARSAEADVRYTVNIYNADDGIGRGPSRSPVKTITTTRDDISTLDTRVAVELLAGSYRAIVWADYVEHGSQDDHYYLTSDFANIAVTSDSGHPGNTDLRDGFRGQADLEVTAPAEGALTVGVPMKRPMAKFRFITTDLDDFLGKVAGERSDGGRAPSQVAPVPGDYTVRVRYTGYMPSTYNAFTDKPVDSRLGVWFDAEPRVISGSEAEMGCDYVFVNGSETSVQVALEVYSRADGTQVASTDAITVPLVRSRLTEVRGRFLTTQAQGGVGISPGFDNEFNIEIK